MLFMQVCFFWGVIAFSISFLICKIIGVNFND
jgi:hypothetical protein